MSASTERKNRAAAKAAGTDKKTNAALEAEQKARKSKRKWIIGTVAVILCIALVLFLSSPLMYRITPAVSVGSKTYSPAELSYVRSSIKPSLAGYGYDNLAAYFGQETADSLLDNAVNSSLVENAALLQYAKDNNISLSAQEKAQIAKSISTQMDMLKEAAKTNGVSLSTYIGYVIGPGVNEGIMRSNMEDSLLTQKAYFSKFCSLSFTPEELAAYYEDPADADLFSYAMFLVKADETRSAEEAKAAAEAVVMSFTDGWDEEVEPDVALTDILAEEFPEEAPTVCTGVTGSQLDETARAWLTEEGRAKGDITSLEAADGTGWYVFLFLDRTANDAPAAAVRHILIKAEADEEGVYTDEAKEAARVKAQEILDSFNQGDKSEAAFAVLAYLLSEDTGSRNNGGLYSAVTQGQMVPEFDAFCFEDHAYGDTGLVYGESAAYAGYHVMFYVEKLPAKDAAARDALRNTAMTEWFSSLTEGLEPVTRWGSKW